MICITLLNNAWAGEKLAGLVGHLGKTVEQPNQSQPNLGPRPPASPCSENTATIYLETISACARQHFVDAQHVEGVDADPDVELILGRVLHHVLQGYVVH